MNESDGKIRLGAPHLVLVRELRPGPTSSTRWDLVEVLRRQSLASPEADAIVDNGCRVTYRQLEERVGRLAEHFATAGVGAHTPVGVVGSPMWETVAAMYAALSLGATVIPLNPALGQREVLYVLQHSEVEYLVGPTRPTQSRGHRSEGVNGLNSHDVLLRAPRLRELIPLRGTDDSIERLAQGPASMTFESREGGLRFYTNKYGSFLRGVNVRMTTAMQCGREFGSRLRLTSEDRHLTLLPLSSSSGFIDVLLATHLTGGAVVFAGRFDATRAVEAAVTEGCTITGGSAVPIRRFLEAARETFSTEPAGFPINRFWSVPTLPESCTEGLSIDQFTCYGLTEAGNMVAVSSEPVAGSEAVNHGSPMPGVSVRIVDSETGAELPCGQLGEICFLGSNMTPGYHRGSHLLNQQLDADGYFHTRDFGFLDAAGRLTFVENRSHLVRSGGDLVSEAEVERIVESECDGVARAAVVGVPDLRWGEVVVAFVELEADVALTLEELHAQCARHLATYKLPRFLIHMGRGEWPYTLHGEVDKVQLRLRAEAAMTEQSGTAVTRPSRSTA
jgi:acyl-CoA synthetase (AMP-forming)/AMP-acid ligase II